MTPIFEDVIAEGREVYNFVSKPRIEAIRVKAVKDGRLRHNIVAKLNPDTRMNLTDEHLTTVHKQDTFIAILPADQEYLRYYEERDAADKARLDGFLANCNHGRWQRMKMCTKVTA